MANTWTRFASRVRGVFARGEDPRRVNRFLPLPMQAAGITLTYDGAVQLSVVWACMDAITKAIASSMWRVFERRGRTRLMLPDDPLWYTLNTRPNPEMTAIAFRECLLYQALSWGNGYAEIVRDGAGRVSQVWPMFSDRMAMRRAYNEDGSPGDIFYEYYQFDGAMLRLRPDQVFHLRGPSPQGWIGDNMVARAAKAVALGVAQERFSAAFFANGASAGLVLKNQRPLDDKAWEKVRDRWNDEHLGPDKASRVAVLDSGWDIDTVSTKPVDMELMAARKFQLEEICRFFGVPPHRVQDLSRATYNNIEHLGLEFCRDALTPWCERMEQEADFKLFPQRAPWRSTNIDIDWLSHGDAGARSGFYEKMRNMGVFSANDILEKENLNTIGPEGDLRLVMSNYTTMGGVAAMVEQTELENEGLAALNGGTAPPPPADPPDRGGQGGGVQDRARRGTWASWLLHRRAQETLAPPPAESSPASAATPAASARDSLMGAVEQLASGALERYARRLQARRADLEKKKTHQPLEYLLAEERARQRPKLAEELGQAFSYLLKECAFKPSMPDFLMAADEVDNGMDPLSVTRTLIARCLGDGKISGNAEDVPGSE